MSAHVRPAEMLPLGRRGRAYLIEHRQLSPETVDAFAHRLRETRSGRVHAKHNEQGNGEEQGEDGSTFVGNEADDESCDRSLWTAAAAQSEYPSLFIVARDFVSGLSAWEVLPAGYQARAGIVSTAGGISAAGAERLEQLIGKTRDRHEREAVGREVWLFDASDLGGAATEQLTTSLAAAAERAGIGYHRLLPPGDAQNWNDALTDAKDSDHSRHSHCTQEDSHQEPTSESKATDLPTPKPTRTRKR